VTAAVATFAAAIVAVVVAVVGTIKTSIFHWKLSGLGQRVSLFAGTLLGWLVLYLMVQPLI